MGPSLTPGHRSYQRLEFVRHVRIGRSHLNNIMFTDESKFNLDFHAGRRWIWRQMDERFHDCCVSVYDRLEMAQFCFWPGFLMAVEWISTSPEMVLWLVFVTEMKSCFAGEAGQDFVLIDNNARPHRASTLMMKISNVWTGQCDHQAAIQ